MAGGRQPDFRLKARLKNQEGGRQYIDLGAAWKNDRGKGYNVKLAPGLELHLAGSVIDGSSHWIDMYENAGSPAPSRPANPSTSRPNSGYNPPPEEDIPF